MVGTLEIHLLEPDSHNGQFVKNVLFYRAGSAAKFHKMFILKLYVLNGKNLMDLINLVFFSGIQYDLS